jgi:hypothetical protein
MNFLGRRNFLLFHVLLDDFLHFFHPRVLGYGFQRGPFFRLELEDLLDEVLSTIRKFGINLVASFEH